MKSERAIEAAAKVSGCVCCAGDRCKDEATDLLWQLAQRATAPVLVPRCVEAGHVLLDEALDAILSDEARPLLLTAICSSLADDEYLSNKGAVVRAERRVAFEGTDMSVLYALRPVDPA